MGINLYQNSADKECMIELSIHSHHDPISSGIVRRHTPAISIGRSPRSDIILLDPEIDLHHLIVEIQDDKGVIYSPSRSVFLLNGKKATSLLHIKAGDQVTLGTTLIEIIRIAKEYQPTPTKDAVLKKTELLPSFTKLIEDLAETIKR